MKTKAFIGMLWAIFLTTFAGPWTFFHLLTQPYFRILYILFKLSFWNIFSYTDKHLLTYFPAGSYMFKINNKDTRKRPWRRSGIFIVNFEHISHLALVFLLLTLSREMSTGLLTYEIWNAITVKNRNHWKKFARSQWR